MSYKEIIKIYNSRKEKIENLMEQNNHLLDEKRQLQLQGAVDEINLFISVLEQYRQKTVVMKNQPSLDEMQSMHNNGLWNKVKSSMFS